jgi:branched-chain amino acid transport system ATP-binding protein
MMAHSIQSVPKHIEGNRALLSVDHVVVRFGGIVALADVSFKVNDGEITGLIGPNGAGKTTVFNCLSRFHTPSEGDIQFLGKSIIGVRPHNIPGIGIGRTFQNVALFSELSVLDNIRVGAHARTYGNLVADGLRLPWLRTSEGKIMNLVQNEIQYLDLGRFAHVKVRELPFAIQKRVELARALVTRPRLLLLDEPAAGLNHEEVEVLGHLVRRLADEFEIAVLLVEHHMQFVMSLCSHIIVLDFGRKIAEGSPGEIRRDEKVIKAYLGDVE